MNTQDGWSQTDRDDYYNRVETIITLYGHLVQGVFISDDDDEEARAFGEFSYTVGLERTGRPEIIVCGFPPDIATTYLNVIANMSEDSPELLVPGLFQTPLTEYPSTLIEVTPDFTKQLLTVANLHAHGDTPVKALQLTFPDRDHRWPWELESEFFGFAPLLGRPPEGGT